jgi:hypothetical protein
MMILGSCALDSFELVDESVLGNDASDSVVCQSDDGGTEDDGSGEVAHVVEGEA